MWRLVFALCILCQVVLSFNVPYGWKQHSRAESDENIRVAFAVKHKDNEIIPTLFDEIALPSGNHFRKSSQPKHTYFKKTH